MCSVQESASFIRFIVIRDRSFGITTDVIYCFFDVSGISSLNNVGEDKSIMLKSYRGYLSIHPRRYELSLGSCRSDDLSLAPIRGDEHDAHDIIRH